MSSRAVKTIEKVSVRQLMTVVISALAIFAVFSAIYFLANLNLPKVISIGGKKVKAELAVSEIEKAKGLSGQSGLCPDCGLLFVYDGYFIPNFWMKDMLFPIDIIWIKDNMVVGFERNVAPPKAGELLATYQPQIFVNYVLEVPAGFIERNDIKIGDGVKF